MANEAANEKRVRFYFVHNGDLDAVKLDEDEQVDDAETLYELLQPPIADPCLTALRRIMSMTYLDSLERTRELCVLDIRALAIKPLGELGTELEALRLLRVDADRSFEHDRSAQVFQYNIVRAKDLRRRVHVKGSGQRQPLIEIFKHIPADSAIRALREILSMTFREATTPRQLDWILEDVRYAAAAALVPCNPILEQIGLEPVAMPTWRRFVDGVDTLDGSDDEDDLGGFGESRPVPPTARSPVVPDARRSTQRRRW